MYTPASPLLDSAPSLARTTTLSRIFAWMCAVTAVGAVAITLVFARATWLRPEVAEWARVAIIAGWIVSIGFLIWGLYSGRASFAALARGEWFARRTIAGLRNLALGILLFKIASFVLFVGAAVIAPSPAYRADVTFRDLFDGMFTLISLGAIVLIANVLTRAAEIAEDNAEIV